MKSKRKILVIGSGPIKIGEAAEFDYSGSQALRAIREEGFESILVNSNVATVQTSHEMSDKVYLLPVNPHFVESVIQKERPWGIMVGFGGQTALSAGIELSKHGVLDKYRIRVLGTGISGIESALSREKFRKTMKSAGLPIPPNASARSKEVALKAAKNIGYPVMVRVSFNLAGRGSAVAWSESELAGELERAFAQSSEGEVLIERYLHGWKEVEYEVVRDSMGNCAVIACIENMDPMGIHTGDSVVVTPAQTLDNKEYQDMRTAAIKVAEAIDLIGECNVQFALDPKGNGFYIIETNPRMSRSSALASKATGYPLAYVSAKLALGHKLHEIKNNVSKSTSAFFEPSLDYVTIKIPRWDLAKFDGVSESVGTEMKSIGEVMAIGRSMEEAFQKAVRMIDIGEPGIVGGAVYNSSMAKEEVIGMLKARKPYWFLYAAKGFKEGLTVRQIHDATLVDEFFLERIKAIVDAYEKRGKDAKGLDGMGFSSAQAGRSAGKRICIKQIDTLAGEWPARTNYLYSTDKGSEDDIGAAKGKKLLVLGAGVFRIGVSVEFDYGAVALADSAKKYFNSVSMLNYNPETVSTDWDRVDRLYFDELTNETITAICEKEKFESVATFAAGQIGNNLSLALEKNGIKLLGTMGSNIDRAEDRNKFSALLERLGIRQPNWTTAASLQEIRSFIERYGFPVLVRPSYVLSGSAMKIANSVQELIEYTEKATRLSPAHPAIISSFIKDAVEAELDCGADGRNVIGVSMYHIEEAGVHSGDATIATPYIDHGSSSEMKEIALRLVNELEIRGPFNLQFIIDRSGANVIELNLRASRSMPFASKSVGANIIDYSVRGILGKYDWTGFNEPKHSSFAVKSAQFSWGQLKGAYPCLGPEMRSTGESASLGRSLESALVKSWLGVQPNRLPRSSVLIYGDKDRTLLKQVADILSESIAVSTLEEAPMHNHPTIDRNKALEMIHKNGIDLIITNNDMRETDYSIRRSAADLNIPLVLNARMGLQLARSLHAAIDCDELGEYWKTGRRKTYENQRI